MSIYLIIYKILDWLWLFMSFCSSYDDDDDDDKSFFMVVLQTRRVWGFCGCLTPFCVLL